MKKLWIVPALAATVCFALTGCSAPAKGTVNQDGMKVFPVSSFDEELAVNMGDVMPFYDDGVMNIYNLRDVADTGNAKFEHPIARLTTTDFVHYTDEGVVLNYETDINSVDTSLGTGSVIKDVDGVYHFFYGGHNPANYQVVRHAVSDDKQHWTKIEDFNLYGDCFDFRDPYLYYDEADGCYYMLIMTQINGHGVIKQYASESLNAADYEWRDCGVFFSNDEGDYNLECPSYIEYNGYYYLAYSEQGARRVTHYRYRTEKDGDWLKFSNDTIDGPGFYAGRLEKAGDELYAFAWCAVLSGGSTGDFDWAGNLIVHKLSQKSDGELCATIVPNVKSELSNKVSYKLAGGGDLSDLVYDGTGFRADCVEELSENITRISFTVTAEDFNGDFGLTFGLNGGYDNRLSNAVVAFEARNSRVACYNEAASVIRYGNALATVPFGYTAGKSYNVDVIIDGEIVCVYLDDTVAVTARFAGAVGSNFAFYSNGAKARIEGITVYE